MLEPSWPGPRLRPIGIALALAAATLLHGQGFSIAVRDVVYDSNGQPFTGSVIITATNASDPNALYRSLCLSTTDCYLSHSTSRRCLEGYITSNSEIETVG